MNKKKVGPLIPLDDLKKVVSGLVAVPKRKAKIVQPKSKNATKKR